MLSRLKTTSRHDHYPAIQVTALDSSAEQLAAVNRVVGLQADEGLARVTLVTPDSLHFFFRLFNAVLPFQRLYVLKRHRRLFESFDALVVPEMTSARLKTRLGVSKTPLILLPDGAGDRAIGFCKEIRDDDSQEHCEICSLRQLCKSARACPMTRRADFEERSLYGLNAQRRSSRNAVSGRRSHFCRVCLRLDGNTDSV